MDGAQAAACVCQSSCGVPRGISIRACPIDERRWRAAERSSSARSRARRSSRSSQVASWIDERFDAVRAFARRAISQAVGRWSARSAAIVAAIVIGDRTGLDAGVQRRLQEAGTYHVIAISGGNIAILAGLMLGLFRLAGVLGRTAMLASIAALAGYGYLVGGGASVDRATLMAVVYLAGRAIDQRSPPLNTLAFVAACLVATQTAVCRRSRLRPHLRRDARHSRRRCPSSPDGDSRASSRRWSRCSWHRWPPRRCCFPCGALVFSRVTFAGLVLNFVAIPLMGVAQVAGMARRAGGPGVGAAGRRHRLHRARWRRGTRAVGGARQVHAGAHLPCGGAVVAGGRAVLPRPGGAGGRCGVGA